MGKRFKRIYVEVTNICNLSCSFCPGHHRPARMMSSLEFETILKKIKDYTDYVYYHVMGEPLLNHDFGEMLKLTKEYGLKSCLTTNGTLLMENKDVILENAANIHQLSISLQCQQGNNMNLESYLKDVMEFGLQIKDRCNVCYRLWNIGGADQDNNKILEIITQYYPGPWRENDTGYALSEKTYIGFDSVFDWPSLEKEYQKSNRQYCYGLKNQLAILVDGSVCCCCLDHEGDINLGNIFEDDLETIINSKRALAIIKGFEDGKAIEELCQKCSFASRFTNENQYRFNKRKNVL